MMIFKINLKKLFILAIQIRYGSKLANLEN